ncbi:MAG: DnaJ domain-containing protein [Desulfamplus sp.]|nr:DnaJ domain-containing protein [Desulfamplus sp.]
MLKSLLILDLPIDSSDQEIRKRYLELVKQFTPEKNPAQFRKITDAYEAVKDQRNRVKSRLFSALEDIEFENTLTELVQGLKFVKKRVGLKELMSEAEKL